MGFQLEGKIKERLEDCALAKDVKFLVSYIKDENISESIQKSIDKCFDELWSDSVYQKVKIANKYIPLLKEIVPQKIKKQKPIWHKLIQTDDLVAYLRNQELSKSKILINELGETQNDLFAKLLRALIFSLRSNEARANAELLTILNYHPLEFSFHNYINDKDYNTSIETQSLRIMIELNKNPALKEIVSVVAIHLARNLTSDLSVKLSFHFDTNLSVSELNEKVNSSNLGLKLPGVWFPIIWEKQSLVKAEEYLFKSIKYFPEYIKNYPWIFYDYFPANNEIRQKILNLGLSPLVLDKTQIAMFRKMNFADNMFVKKWFEEQEKKKATPLFKLKRDFFHETLTKQVATDLALYNLFELGDYDIKFFQWTK